MKRYSVFVIAALMACTAIFFGLRSHHRKAAEMHAALDSALVQNRNYVAFTSDSLLKEVVAYFDRWGSANDRLRAHYALGCAYRDLHDAPIALLAWEDAIAAADTTSADCDYATLFRVYGQMADVYYRQFMPEKELEARDAYCIYALRAGDTLNYIRGLLLQNSVYFALDDTAAIFHNIEHVRALYLERGLKAEAAQVYPSAIKITLDNQHFERVGAMMQIFEQESGLFDEQGNIAPSREIYYYFKGMYYLGVHQFDSAEYQFRKLFPFEVNLVDAYRGLLSLYKQKHNVDSIFRYARLYEDALARYLKNTHIQSIDISEGMYDYNLQQLIAQEQKERANRLKIALLLFSFLFTIIALLVHLAFQKKKEEKRKILNIYRDSLDELDKAKRDIGLLQQSLSQKEIAKKLIQEKEEQIRELEIIIRKQHKQMGKSAEAILLQRLEESEIVQTFHLIANPHLVSSGDLRKLVDARFASDDEWDTLFKTLQVCHPGFYLFLQKQKLSKLKSRVCVLSYLGFDNSDISTLTNAKIGSVTNARMALAKDLFGLTSARYLNKKLLEIEKFDGEDID